MGNVCTTDNTTEAEDISLSSLPIGAKTVSSMNLYSTNVSKTLENLKILKIDATGSRISQQDSDAALKVYSPNPSKPMHRSINQLPTSPLEAESKITGNPENLIVKYPNGDTYYGSFNRNKKEGYGELVTSKGDLYRGTFFRDGINGAGMYISADGFFYKGNFIEGKVEGSDALFMNEFMVYSGPFKMNKFDGLAGNQIFKDGTVYIGSFKEGEKSGRGFLSLPNNGGGYDGEFKNDEFDGQGQFSFSNGKIYIGGFKEGKMSGKGRMVYSPSQKEAGGTYDGFFVNGFKHGSGKRTWGNGNTYEGEWFEGLQHGKGVMTQKGGARKEGVWRKGEFQK